MTDKRCIEDLDEIREIKNHFKEEYYQLLFDTNTITGIGMDNNDCYIITLRCEKEGTLDSLPKTYLGAQFDIQYIQYKPY